MNQKAEFPDLPGIDLEAGLNVVRGNTELYTRLLIKFADSYVDFDEQFGSAQNEDDSDAARRSAHSLKGVAGNLGATQLAEAAFELEKACAENSTELDSKRTAVNNELQKVLQGVELLR